MVDGVGGPDPNVSITASGRKALAIGRNVAAVYLEVLLLTAVAQPRGLYDVHVGGVRRMGFGVDANEAEDGDGDGDGIDRALR